MKKKVIWIVVILTLLFVGCVTVYNPATGRKESYLFDEKYEINLGNSVAKQIISQSKMVDDPEVLAYVREIGEKVAEVSHRSYLDYKFYIVDSEEINAFALLGGHIFVNKGLIDTVSEDELAFVLSHEVGHVCARHGLKRFQAAFGLQILMAVLSSQSDQKAIGDLIGEVDKYVSLGFSRKDEYQADALGVTYAYQAGYDPKAALATFERFEEIEKEYDSAAMPVFLRSHPKPKDRYAAVNIKIKELISSDTEDSSSKIKDFRKKSSE